MTPIRIGREVLGDLTASSRHEWLVTNGIGGYAAGTVGGALTRRYHGLLIAARKPPVERTLLLAKIGERMQVDGKWVDLDLNHWRGGASSPLGHLHMESFALEGAVPVWTWAIGNTRLEKRVWMEQGHNITYVQYRLVSASSPVTLSLKAMVDHRDHHTTTSLGETPAAIEKVAGGMSVNMGAGTAPLWLFAAGAEFKPANVWYRHFALAIETERGLDDEQDLLFAGEITRVLEPGEAFTLVASTRHDSGRGLLSITGALQRRRSHEKSLIDSWQRAQGKRAKDAPEWIRQLVLAADAFVVERAKGEGEEMALSMVSAPRSILAGYPWFTDWGRDTMIALPGLLLTTGRPELARAVLTTFAAHVDHGMLPNMFPDDGSAPEYNTADAALWFFQAVQAYMDATEDTSLLEQVYPALEDIGAWYERGTRFGIGVDPRDGLVSQGSNGHALTWMDARVEDWVVTPRKGKPVEINALWFAALAIMSRFALKLGRPHESYDALGRRAGLSFQKFWNDEQKCLFDVLDSPTGPDASLRPNQIFAVSLRDTPLDAAQRRAVVDTVGRTMLTSHGLRSLAPGQPGYRARMTGDRRIRDGAYHQGTVWTWLLPHYALAHFRAYGDSEAALALLEPYADLMRSMAMGTLPEVADGDAPHTPRGCFAQAWTVGETLRAYHELVALKPKIKTGIRAAAPRRAKNLAVTRT